MCMKKQIKKRDRKSNNNVLFTQSWHAYVPPTIIACLVGLLYYPSLYYKFQVDDLASITRYFAIRNKGFFDLLFTGTRWISYWMNTIHYSIGKFNPFCYRLTNISMHALTSILVFYFVYIGLKKLKNKEFYCSYALPIALLTACLFAIHPVQTQTVSYVIQGQLEGLACFFLMLMSLSFLLYNHTTNPLAKKIYLGLVFCSAFLGTGTKEIFVVAPLLLLLTDWFLVAQADMQSLKSRWYIHGIVFGIVIGVYMYFLKPSFFGKLLGLKLEAKNNIGNILTETRDQKIYPLHFFMSQFKVVLHYIWMFIWPFNICVEYDWKLSTSFFAFDCIVPFLTLCAIASGLWYLFKKDKSNVLVFSALWFFVVLAPRSTIIPSSELLTDYKTFSGSMAILLFLAICIVYCLAKGAELVKSSLWHHKNIVAQYALIILLVLPVGYVAKERNKVWHSAEEFWTNIIKNAPGKARAYNNYAVALSEQGKFKESIPFYAKAIQMDSHYPDPINNIAVAFASTGDLDKGIQYMQMAIKQQPNYPEGYNNLASFLIQKEEYEKAIKMCDYAIRLRPHYGKARYNKGKALMSLGKNEKAFECFKDACTKADLDNETGFKVYAQMSMSLKKYADAVIAYSKLLEFRSNGNTMFLLGNAHFMNKEYPQAIQWYKKAERTLPDNKQLCYNLAEAYLKNKDYEKALAHFDKMSQMNYKLPNLPLRRAYCLKLLNRNFEAKVALESALTRKDITENFKQIAKNELAKIDQAAEVA